MKPRGEKKKLTIKPFSSTPTLPPDFEEQAWDRLKRAVEAVIAEKAIDISKEELYRVSQVLLTFECICIHLILFFLFFSLSHNYIYYPCTILHS